MYCILALVIIGAASALECGPETCAVVGLSLPLNCKGTVIKNGGFCGCYDVCAKQAGESCQARPGLDGRSTYGTCEPGLICVPHGEMVSLGYGRCHIPRTPRFLNTLMSHNTPCEQQRRARLMSMAVWRGQWVPVCDSQGNYVPHQCDNIGQCFCVETHSGKMLTAKSLGAVDCTGRPEAPQEVASTTTPTKAPAVRLLDIKLFLRAGKENSSDVDGGLAGTVGTRM
ncbi:nidogen-2-like [Pecten maximus]|uniref:nidogen-2-like n=1 Tax=Pecten maximus TaxID=6579 RepID=UPI001458C0A2|nr:nidogen-2-like [Pecten maximus]